VVQKEHTNCSKFASVSRTVMDAITRYKKTAVPEKESSCPNCLRIVFEETSTKEQVSSIVTNLESTRKYP